jgi:hypothetical protein
VPGGLGAFAIVVLAAVVVIAFFFVWLLSRDEDVARTSFGFHVERTRYEEEPPFEPGEPPVTVTQEWPGPA